MFPSPGQRCDYHLCIALNYIFMTPWFMEQRKFKNISTCSLHIESSEESELLHQIWMLKDQSWMVVGCRQHTAPWQTLLRLGIIEKGKLAAAEKSVCALICGWASKVQCALSDSRAITTWIWSRGWGSPCFPMQMLLHSAESTSFFFAQKPSRVPLAAYLVQEMQGVLAHQPQSSPTEQSMLPTHWGK